ncbi:response regulator transcription factor [Gorillibacterium sp. sgz5001074]|uniref:response regulator transcription factor n=1 Tax=Gorillibacterium sp. sgz5001074 TaxID=3446695 RepID=UPI003F6710C9
MFHLLIVDDYPDQVESIASTIPLQELDIGEVYKAYSGMEALEILRSFTVDIVITDIRMPGMSGLELVERIREDNRSAKYIFISGHADFEYAQRAIVLQSSYYLLKPVSTEELVETLRSVVSALHDEWKRISSYQQAVYTLRENMSLLSGELLNHLLQGRRYPKGVMEKKVRMLDLPFRTGDRTGMFIIRLEEEFDELDDYDLSLMEFAVANIACELFGDLFHLWHCKDSSDNLVFLVKPIREQSRPHGEETPGEGDWHRIEKRAAMLHKNVSVYLKRSVSVAVAKSSLEFPAGVSRAHQSCLAAVRSQIGTESNFYILVEDEPEQGVRGCLTVPYQPPLLIHLLETGSWERASGKLDDMLSELAEKWAESPEYALEMYAVVMSSFHYIAHKNGRQLAEIVGNGGTGLVDGAVPVRSYKQLKDWVCHAFTKLMEEADRSTRSSRSLVVKRIHQFIDTNIGQDLSLQAVSEHVKLHPAYLSKVYKTETGLSLGDYIVKVRMEQAAELLRNGSGKIYEIASQTGYLTTHYFSKVFKNYHGMTPQEYRETVGK